VAEAAADDCSAEGEHLVNRVKDVLARDDDAGDIREVEGIYSRQGRVKTQR